MEQHALEISYGLATLVGGLFLALCWGVLWYFQHHVVGKLDGIDANQAAMREAQDQYVRTVATEARAFRAEITTELSSIRRLLGDEVFALRELIHDIDKRLVKVESRCMVFHLHDNEDDGK